MSDTPELDPLAAEIAAMRLPHERSAADFAARSEPQSELYTEESYAAAVSAAIDEAVARADEAEAQLEAVVEDGVQADLARQAIADLDEAVDPGEAEWLADNLREQAPTHVDEFVQRWSEYDPAAASHWYERVAVEERMQADLEAAQRLRQAEAERAAAEIQLQQQIQADAEAARQSLNARYPDAAQLEGRMAEVLPSAVADLVRAGVPNVLNPAVMTEAAHRVARAEQDREIQNQILAASPWNWTGKTVEDVKVDMRGLDEAAGLTPETYDRWLVDGVGAKTKLQEAMGELHAAALEARAQEERRRNQRGR